MTLTVTQTGPGFAAEVGGVDLTKDLPPETIAALRKAIDTQGVLVFHDQPMDDARQVAFSRHFGTLETSLGSRMDKAQRRPDVSYLSDVDAAGNILPPDADKVAFNIANQAWHTDSSFKPVPASYSLLSAREIPQEGGNTEFADTRAAYEDWPGWEGVTKAELEGLICEHSIVWSRKVLTGYAFKPEDAAAAPPARQLLVRVHPATGRPNFFVGAHAERIVQWPLERGRALIASLNAWCTQPRYVFAHQWRTHDLVMWDNRRVLHRGRPFDVTARRVMHRTTVAGEGPTVPADSPHALPATQSAAPA